MITRADPYVLAVVSLLVLTGVAILLFCWWLSRRLGHHRAPALIIMLPLAVFTGTIAWRLGMPGSVPPQTSLPTLPPIALATLTGDSLNLQTLNDRPMVVNLWATWCLPCRREMPVLEAAQQRDTWVNYVFINQAESVEQITDYLADEGLVLDNVLLDATAVSGRLLDVRGLPSTYFFDAEGNMINIHTGELSPATLRQQLRNLR